MLVKKEEGIGGWMPIIFIGMGALTAVGKLLWPAFKVVSAAILGAKV